MGCLIPGCPEGPEPDSREQQSWVGLQSWVAYWCWSVGSHCQAQSRLLTASYQQTLSVFSAALGDTGCAHGAGPCARGVPALWQGYARASGLS